MTSGMNGNDYASPCSSCFLGASYEVYFIDPQLSPNSHTKHSGILGMFV